MSRPPGAGGPVRIGLTGPDRLRQVARSRRWLAEPGRDRRSMPTRSPARSPAPGEPAHDAVLARFGERGHGGRRPAGSRRPRRGSCSPIPRRSADLEAIVHPAVRPRILAAIDGGRRPTDAPAVVIEAIKLVEGGLADAVRRGLARDLRAAVQRERLARPRRGAGRRGAPDRGPGRARRAGRARGDARHRTSGPLVDAARELDAALAARSRRRPRRRGAQFVSFRTYEPR